MNNFIENRLSKLKNHNFLNPEIELRAILKHSSKKNKDIFLNNFNINHIDYDKFKLIFNRRINNEPLSKIINNKEFYSYSFYVTNNVLDPRPETEFLIDITKKYFPDYNQKIKICDLGTGSGCLAIVLAIIYKNSKITATDISIEALNIAMFNAKKHNVLDKINFINCNWINFIEEFDLIISNPPYLSESDYKHCSKEIRCFEPRIALEAGIDGLDSFKKIAALMTKKMKKKSLLLIEIGENQKDDIIKIFHQHNIRIMEIIKDYQLKDRVLVMKK